VGHSSKRRMAAAAVGVEGGCLDPTVIELHVGGTLDLEVETARRKKLRTGSTTGASTVMNPNVLGLGFKI
jgi:hypothetical protein